MSLINFVISISIDNEDISEITYVKFSYNGKELTLLLDTTSKIVAQLNQDKSLNYNIKKILKQYFHFEGKFVFVEELPF